MNLSMGTARRTPAESTRPGLSRADAYAIMILTAAAAAMSTVMAGSWIASLFSGPVTLTLPIQGTQQQPDGLGFGATGAYTQMEATISAVPAGEASMLAWSAALNQVGALAVAALIFLLAFRLRGENLFTAGSAWIIGSCGAILALSGSAAEVLESTALTRLSLLIGATPQTPGEDVFLTFTLNVVPVVAGLTLVLVALAFRSGRQLQEDTEGLI